MRTSARTSGTNISRRRAMSQEGLERRVDLGGRDRTDGSEADDSLAVHDKDPGLGFQLPRFERRGAGFECRRRRLVVRSGQELLDVDEVGGTGAALLEHED